jgi:hypothetical protein
MGYLKIQKKISVNAFSCDVLFIVSDNINKVENYLHKKHGTEKPKDGDNAEGYTITITPRLYAMVLDYQYLTHNLIGHEIFHVTHRIAEDRDISDEETQAWICGFLCEEFFKFYLSDKMKNWMTVTDEQIKTDK